MKDIDKQHVKKILQRYTTRHRFELSVIVCVIGGLWWLFSYSMYHLEVDVLWIRYSISMLISYPIMAYLLLVWLQIISSRITAQLQVDSTSIPEAKEGRGWNWDFSNFDIFGEAEGVFLFLLIIVSVIILAIIVCVALSPILLGELFTSELVLVLMYKQLKKIELELSMVEVMRHTALYYFIVVAAVTACAYSIGYYYPEVRTIVEFLRVVR
ncbi:MAG: hypothetical protein U0264_17065 [Candidatus Kapaibacterium sp.]